MGIPLANGFPSLDFSVFFNQKSGTGRNLVFFELAPFRVKNRNLTVSRKINTNALLIRDNLEFGITNSATFLRANFTFLNIVLANTTNMECPHG